jgi:hypothetical protein
MAVAMPTGHYDSGAPCCFFVGKPIWTGAELPFQARVTSQRGDAGEFPGQVQCRPEMSLEDQHAS